MAAEEVIGGRVSWVSDVEPGPCAILDVHHPDIPNLGDVTAIDWKSVEPVDVITGGSPCQDLSLAGARRGMTTGTRSNLWVAMREAIAVLRPRMVVWENVRGALSAVAESEADREDYLGLGAGLLGDGAGGPALRALGRVLGDLADLGFDAEWCGIRAADVGAPHGRFRVFVVARAADTNGVADERCRVGGELRCSQETTQGEGHQRERGWRASGDRGETDLMPTPDAYLGSRGGASDPEKRRAGDHSVSIADAVSLLPTPQVADVEGGHKRRSGARSDELLLNGIAAEDRFGEYAPAIARWERVLGRPAPAPTDHGRLSARFCEWMMGLPDGWVTDVDISRTAQLRALGNGVVPQQAAVAIRTMLTNTDAMETAA